MNECGSTMGIMFFLFSFQGAIEEQKPVTFANMIFKTASSDLTFPIDSLQLPKPH